MHLTPGWSDHHGVATIIMGSRTVAVETGPDAGLAQSLGEVKVLALIEPPAFVPLNAFSDIGLEQDQAPVM